MAAFLFKILLMLSGASRFAIGALDGGGAFVPNRPRAYLLFDKMANHADLRSEVPLPTTLPSCQDPRACGVSSAPLQQRNVAMRSSIKENEECEPNQEFEPHSLFDILKNIDSANKSTDIQQPSDDTIQQSGGIQRRQFIAASALIAAQLSFSTPSNALDAKALPILNERTNYQQSPINKRSGITLSEPERIYPLNFITYLSRFLLVFDDECQRWWYTQAQGIPAKSSKEEVESIRLGQFGQFAASVEVGLIDFEGKNGEGVYKLIDSLIKRYGPSSLGLTNEELKDPSSSTKVSEREIRKSKEALRQLALLFSLLQDYQPVECITQILAADDDARIEKIEMVDGGAGYYPPAYTTPDITFPEPPTLGTEFGGSVAKGTAIMKESGRLLKIELIQGGRGYLDAPTVEISYPGSTDGSRVQAKAQAIVGKKKMKGSVGKIELVDPGFGYTSLDDITVTISPPQSEDGIAATAKAILEYEVAGINILDEGSGYAAEKAINIVIDPPPGAASGSGGSRSAFAISYPKGRSTI